MNETTRQASPTPVLYPLWQWLVYIPLACLTTVVSAVLAVPLALLVSPRTANLYVAVIWAKILTRTAPVNVDLAGLDNIDPTQSYVVVANHQSQFDIPVIYGYSGLDLRWVMKAELSKVPFVAAGCRAIGHVFVKRGDPDQWREAINQALSRLPNGTGILFFAEGTRSRSGELLPFKKGAFRVAIDQQWPILPVTLIGTREVMPADSVKITPGTVRMIVHPPIATAGMTSEDLGRLSLTTQGVIAKALRPADA